MSVASSHRARVVLAMSSLVLAVLAPPVPRAAAAQARVPAGGIAAARAAAPAPVPGTARARLLADTTVRRERAPVARVVLGTAVGGAALATPGVAIMLAPCHEIICGTQLFGAATAVTGYVVGSALGARLAAEVQGARPPVGRILLASFLGAIAGGVVWNRVGETAEPDKPGVADDSSWRLGAAAGVALHIALTSIVALHAPPVPRAPVPAPPPPVTTPTPDPPTH